ncbi:Dephospho-CoA kinase/protein folding accessory domain-containing protein [Planctomycetales bacterium 10988]|nr:Dephospho-CoA kinase/protein folding accessory domain-containing protein [Planctomycetales bacterium 10988]
MNEPLEIVAYKPTWPARYEVIAERLAEALQGLEIRIDHIGSTSVPELASKDRIDVQITIPTGEEAYISELNRKLAKAGLGEAAPFEDHRPPGDTSPAIEWQKWYLRGNHFPYPCNIHIRVQGRKNQVYPLLFRDFLRANQPSALAYGEFKQRLARLLPEDRHTYCDVKDPVCDLILEHAQKWAAETDWKCE